MTLTKDNILRKLEIIFWYAIKNHKWHTALQAVERPGKNQEKNIGMFKKSRLPKATRLSDMMEDQLCKIIDALEKLYPELKNAGDTFLEDMLKKASDWNHSQPELKPPQCSACV